jgi:ADP-ribosylglycohydrolase
MMPLTENYYERVYAGVLGKIIGVYLGRPFEGWPFEQIMRELGEINYYVNGRSDLPFRNHPLVVTDDDISGTFAFFRALSDYNNSRELSPAQIGQTWLNYIIENRTILWWGGMGNSTEHTAFLRLKNGIRAPRSGSMDLNGRVVSEQIGAQIFIEGWGLVSPGDPEFAMDLARRAASVSHDGEAVFGAQVVAGLVSQAFVEPAIDPLLDTVVSLIPPDSTIKRMIDDIRSWHAGDSLDWMAARQKLDLQYGYHKYGGNCHIVPNHGLVILSLLFSGGNFSHAQKIVNTCGWDTDCNAANTGCILGVRNGLAAFEGDLDWRGPVADRLYIPTADAGSAVSDALQEADRIVQSAYAVRGEAWIKPKAGARFHFSLLGAVQGFRASGRTVIVNDVHPVDLKSRALQIRVQLNPEESTQVVTPVFIPPDAVNLPGYGLYASPALYPGQIVRARVIAGGHNLAALQICLVLQYYAEMDQTAFKFGDLQAILPGEQADLEWQIPALDGMAICAIGINVTSADSVTGHIFLDWLNWGGEPAVTFNRPALAGNLWKAQWVNAVDSFGDENGDLFRLVQNSGRGLIISGARDWHNYQMDSTITPHLAKSCGLAVRVQGLERYYAVLLTDQNKIVLVKRLDGEQILAQKDFKWELGQSYEIRLQAVESRISAWVNGELIFTCEDKLMPLVAGGVAVICEEGRIACGSISVHG